MTIVFSVAIKSIKALLLFVLLGILACTKSKVERDHILIYTPATPASIPVLLAGSKLPETKVIVYANHPQAYKLFLDDQIDILITGLSVGVQFYKNHPDIRILNSHVNGLSYLLSDQDGINNFRDLKSETLHIPFENSPLDEVSRFFIEKEGLNYGKDIKIKYSMPYATRQLLIKGKAKHAPLPEPLVTALVLSGKSRIAFSYKDHWQKITGKKMGYPQLGSFVKSDFIKNEEQYIVLFHQELQKAIRLSTNHPGTAILQTRNHFQFPQAVLALALKRSSFLLLTSGPLEKEVKDYYSIIGKPLDETYKDFFYIRHK